MMINVDDHNPGLKNEFTVDQHSEVFSDTKRYGIHAFPNYMAQKQLFIDVWDGESLMYLGTCCLNLRPGMRQQKPGISLDDDLEIVWHQFADDSTHPHSRSSSMNSVNKAAQTVNHGAKTLSIGTLHVRMTNLGKPCDQNNRPAMRESVVVYDYHETAKTRLTTLSEPKKLVDVDVELNTVLHQAMQERMAKAQQMNAAKESCVNIDNERLKKAIKVMEKVGLEKPRDEPETETYQQTRQEKERDIKTIEIFRERFLN